MSAVAAEDSDSQIVDVDAIVLARPGTTIAFFPPDACLSTSAAPAGSQEQQLYLRMQCGVLMSELEKAAATRGYKVVSWQYLKGGPAQDRARALRVDALLEVDELVLHERAPDRKDEVAIEFQRSWPPGAEALLMALSDDPEPVTVDLETKQRCREVLLAQHPEKQVQGVTLSAKMTRVSDGRSTWFYRHTSGAEDQTVLRTQIVDEGKQVPDRFRILGLGFLGTGILMLTLPFATDSDELKIGGVFLGSSFSVGGLIPLLSRSDDPDAVICRAKSYGEDAPLPPVLASSDGKSDEYAETYLRINAGDPEVRRREELVRRAVVGFLESLMALAKQDEDDSTDAQ